MVSLEHLVSLLGLWRGLVKVIDLRDLQEVINYKSRWAEHASSSILAYKIALGNIPAIELKLELLVEVLFNVFNVIEVSKGQVVDLVREVKLVSLEKQLLDSLRVMMSANMEVSWHLVDEHKS